MRTWTLVAAAGLVAAAVSAPARRWYLTWGATADEIAEELPGDELLLDADLVSTRAVTIAAPPSAVWPWLIQMGSGRGGAYTYDWIENLFGLNMHSADKIVPELQHLAVGDELPLGKDAPPMRVETCDENGKLVFRSVDGLWVWAFVLRPVAGGTRLISRNRVMPPTAGSVGTFIYNAVMAPGSLVMERRMLIGIKMRAERLSRTAETEGPSALTTAGLSS
ncbi:MAG: SRPBCC family protein [Actinomycetota bacterium]|nr:SRPBCC family protein [Actinomycetota bacterium]